MLHAIKPRDANNLHIFIRTKGSSLKLTSATARTTKCQPSSALPERSGEKAGSRAGSCGQSWLPKYFLCQLQLYRLSHIPLPFQAWDLALWVLSIGSPVPSHFPFKLFILYWRMGFLGGLVVKNLPTVQETQVQSLGWEDPLEKGMATYSSILTWRIPWTEEPGRL